MLETLAHRVFLPHNLGAGVSNTTPCFITILPMCGQVVGHLFPAQSIAESVQPLYSLSHYHKFASSSITDKQMPRSYNGPTHRIQCCTCARGCIICDFAGMCFSFFESTESRSSLIWSLFLMVAKVFCKRQWDEYFASGGLIASHSTDDAKIIS